MTNNIIASNRKAKFNYFIEYRIECGIVLYGSEIKSLRVGKVSIDNAYAHNISNELFLYNCYIPEYSYANKTNHDPRRIRKLLCHAREIKKMIGKVTLQGYTLVPIDIHFNKHKIAKIEIGIAKGKKLYDKRQAIKLRELQRNANRRIFN